VRLNLRGSWSRCPRCLATARLASPPAGNRAYTARGAAARPAM